MLAIGNIFTAGNAPHDARDDEDDDQDPGTDV